MHHPVRRHRGIPAIGLVDPLGCAIVINDQVFRPQYITKRRTAKRRIGCHLIRPASGFRVRMRRFRIWRLETKTARGLDRAQKKLQHMQRAAGLEAVRMRRDTAHCMHRHRTADHLVMPFTLPVGPGLVDHHLFSKGGFGQICRKLADTVRTDANSRADRLGGIGIIQPLFTHQHEDRHGCSAAVHLYLTMQCHLHRSSIMRCRLAGCPVQHLRRARIITQEQPVIRCTRIADNQPRRVGIARQIIDIDLASAQQLADHRQNQQPVRARGHPEPVIRNSRITGLHRIDRNHPCAASLQLAKSHLDRV